MTSSAPTAATPTSTPRPLPYWAFGVIVVVYLGIIHGGGIALDHVGEHDDDLTTSRRSRVSSGTRGPLGAALVFTYAVIGVLRWWRPVFHDDKPVRGWVWLVPLVFVVCSLVALWSSVVLGAVHLSPSAPPQRSSPT